MARQVGVFLLLMNIIPLTHLHPTDRINLPTELPYYNYPAAAAAASAASDSAASTSFMPDDIDMDNTRTTSSMGGCPRECHCGLRTMDVFGENTPEVSEEGTSVNIDSYSQDWSKILQPRLSISHITTSTKVTLWTVDCSNLELSVIPNNMDKPEALLVDRNRVKLAGLTILDLSQLRLLDISANHIYSWTSSTLHGLSRLTDLHIDGNELEYLANCSFLSMNNLKQLTIHRNKLELMHDAVFCGLHHLRSLDLSGNRLYEVNAGWFQPTIMLHYLDLSGNNIHNIRTGDFIHLRNLYTLYLNNNHLKHLQDQAFLGLSGLGELFLQDNSLTVVPTQQLREFTSLKMLDISNIHISVLYNGSFHGVNVSSLHICRMGTLTLVEYGSFRSMPYLTDLYLTNNTHLQFIDNEAFHDVPSLTWLHLENNNLSSIKLDIFSKQAGLRLIIHDNPLYCDCSLRWLQQEILEPDNLTLVNAANITCRFPDVYGGDALSSIPPLPFTCPPRIIPLFKPTQDAALGDSLEAHCRAVAVPQPHIHWLLPESHKHIPRGNTFSRESLNPSFRHKPRHVNHGSNVQPDMLSGDALNTVVQSQEGSLFIEYIQGTDQGEYTCVAVNEKGRTKRSFYIHVTNMQANVLILRITQSSITVTWKSTQSSHMYELLWRPASDNVSYTAIAIKPYMRSYTANQLTPKSLYEFCLAVLHENTLIRMNCSLVSTHSVNFARIGIFNSRQYIVGGIAGCIVAVVALICAITWLSKAYNKRRRTQEELYGDNMSEYFMASVESLSDTTPITYENRAAEIFDEDDIEEIRSAAAAARDSTAAGRR